ncbi:MAG: phosphatase PAP2 family protein [Pseudomonadota bacterium]
MLPDIMYRLRFKLVTVSVVLALTAVLSAPRGVEKIGDNLQFALPILGWGCSIINGQGADYFVRFLTLEVFIHGSKQGLGYAEINMRPNGGDEGFPSGHTSAAAFGASNLIYNCVDKSHWVQGAVLISAAFVGGSRVEAKKHDMWQVLAGFFLGWLTDRLFRKTPGPLKRLRKWMRENNVGPRVKTWIGEKFPAMRGQVKSTRQTVLNKLQSDRKSPD